MTGITKPAVPPPIASVSPLALAAAAPRGEVPSEALLDERRAAAFLDVSPRTLQEWRTRGTGPAFVRVGARVRYCPRTLAAWVRSRRATVTASRKSKPISLSSRTAALPGWLAAAVVRRLAASHANNTGPSPSDGDRLAAALAPYRRQLALALCPQSSALADGRVRLLIAPHRSISASELGPYGLRVPVEYDPRTDQFRSALSAEGQGFTSLCAYIWRLQCGEGDPAALRLLALVGLACLDSLAEGAGA